VPNPAFRSKFYFTKLFLLSPKELPLVAFLALQQLAFFNKSFPLQSGAGQQ